MTSPVQSIEEFLQLARRSGLAEEARLQPVVEPWVGQPGPPPEEMLTAIVDAGVLTRWQIEQLLKGRYKGFLLGKYKLLRLLGAGGMSSVYLAEHATLGNKVAIKVLPVKRVDQTSYLARFEREARQSARLSHPNIVRTFDLDTSGSIHFIAMEFVDGIDLHAYVKQRLKEERPLTVREVADFIRQAALGLQHAHEEGLVHRDIKPANLMLDQRGTVKILDLGLALAGGGEEDGSLTREHDEKVLGTADYLAPEQAADSHKADRRSDIYSLGCTLYYLLVGKPPFASGTLSERIKAHVRRPPPNLLDDRSDVPVAIAELYFRMLEKHPDARPQSAQDVADALGRWLAATSAEAPAGRPEGPRRSLPRRTATAAGDSGPQVAVMRSGPGSTGPSSITVGRQGVGSGVLPIPGPPAAPPRSPRPAAKAAPPAIKIDMGATAGHSEGKADHAPAAGGGKRRSRKPAQFAGLPLGFWIAAAVCLVLVAVLGVMVWQKFSK